MRLRGGQARFLLATIGLWVGFRAAVLSLDRTPGEGAPARSGAPIGAHGAVTFSPVSLEPVEGLSLVSGEKNGSSTTPDQIDTYPAELGATRIVTSDLFWGQSLVRASHPGAPWIPKRVRDDVGLWLGGTNSDPVRGGTKELNSSELQLPDDVRPPATIVAAQEGATSRWSGSAYLFLRPGSGRASLAAGGELGGSQGAARLSYRLNADGPLRTALVGRVYAPLASRGAEAAVGLDWVPLPSVPVRLSVERRFDLDGRGRHAWSAYAAGGFYREELGGGAAIDVYGQAGVVGLRRRDLFVDGALRAGGRFHLGSAVATLGGGLWGAAQPDAARLDVGPRAALALPLAGTDASLAVEGRFRVAGRAAPGSGVALTLAGQF